MEAEFSCAQASPSQVMFFQPHPPFPCSGSAHCSAPVILPKAWEQSCPTLVAQTPHCPLCRALCSFPQAVMSSGSLNTPHPAFFKVWKACGPHTSAPTQCPHLAVCSRVDSPEQGGTRPHPQKKLCRSWLGSHHSCPLEMPAHAVQDQAPTPHSAPATGQPHQSEAQQGLLGGQGSVQGSRPAVFCWSAGGRAQHSNTLPDPLVWRGCVEQHSLGTGDSGWCHLAHRGDLEVSQSKFHTSA